MIAHALLTLALAFAAPAPAPTPQTPAPASLGGPEVERAPARPSIVERGADGSLRELDSLPIEAAIALLELDGEARAKVEAIVLERQRVLDEAVQKNLQTLVQIETERSAGRADEAQKLLKAFVDKAPALRDWAGHRRRLLDALTPAQRAEAERMTEEWRSATLEELKAHSARTGEPMGALAGAVAVRSLGGEIRRAYQRVVSFGQDRLEGALAAIGPTPEQERAIRAIVAEWSQRTGLNPTEADRRDLFVRVARELTSEQVRRLVDFTSGASEAPRPMAP